MAGLGITYKVELSTKVSKSDGLSTKQRATRIDLGKNTFYVIGKGYKHFMNLRVPKDTGALRNTATVLGNNTGANVFWKPTNATRPYMHYQFVGEVYGPNKAKLIDGERQWRSPVKPKWPTGRMMGKRFVKHFKDGTSIEVKGYTTKRPLRTGPDWINKFKSDNGKYGQASVNAQAGRFIYEAYCQQHRKKPVGGYQVYRKWSRFA